MTISRINGATWGVDDELTSAQINGIDVNTTYALDRRAAHSDTLSSTVTAASGASLTFASGSTCTLQSGATCSVAGALTVASGGAVTFASGSSMALATGSTITRSGTGVKLLVDVQITNLTATYTASTGSFTDVTGSSCSVTALAGDLLVIDATAFCDLLSSTSGSVKLVIDDGGVADTGKIDFFLGTPTFAEGHTLTHLHTVVNAGTITAKLQLRTGGTGSVKVIGGASTSNQRSSVRIMQFRP